LIGSVVSHYRVVERLGGEDERSALYKAQDLQQERMVALQLLPGGGGADDEAARQRFAEESSRASSIGDPNIGHVYEVGETGDGRVFLAMALDEGEPLSVRLARGPIGLEKALDVGSQIAAGLASAHAEGIVHGALDASQILVDAEGRVRIVGFGAASLPGAAERARAYLSPQRLRGAPADPRGDLWSLGVLLYEMIAGVHPFPGTDALAGGPEPLPPPLPDDIPADLAGVVTRALAPRLVDRYASAGEIRAALREAEGTGALVRPVSGRSFPPRSGSGLRRPPRPRPGDAPPGGASGSVSPSSMTGRVIGHYVIREHLGGGGMGVVYKAEDTRLERTVALKFLPPELTRDPMAKARFLQEARAASALEHPNICTIHEVDETDDGQLYLAMPAYDGETLKRRIERGPLPVGEAVDIAIQIGQGLAKAHRQGIVHRDIKPANLIVTGDGIVKILDFGLAKLAGAAGLTRAGFCLGTPSYMSPEQARGDVDHRTDLWSLGVVLYEMVAGRPPFRADTDQGIIYALLTDEPEPLRKLRPDAPAELEQIVKGMLAKDPEARYPSLEPAIADLRHLAGVSTGLSRVSLLHPVVRPSRWKASALAAIGGLVLIVAFLLLRGPGGAGLGGEKPLQRTNDSLTDLEGRETHPSLAADGSFFVYAKDAGGDSDIFWQRVGGGNPRNLTADSQADDSQPALSPDGKQIAFRSERDGGGLYVMGATGESAVRLTGEGYDPAWSPDGAWIVYAAEGVTDPRRRSYVSKVFRVRVADGKVEPIATGGDAVQPSWSPNNLRIAYWGLATGTSKRVVYTIPAGGVEGGKPLAVTDGSSMDWNPVWSPDGSYLYFVSDRNRTMTLWRVRIDERSGKVQGDPEDLTTPAEWSGFLSLSGDGKQIAYATRDGKANLESIGFDPVAEKVVGEPRPVTQGSRMVRSGDVSPDGRWIVYDTSLPQEDLYVSSVDGEQVRQLTNDAARDRIPRWSPDGQRILFYSDRGGSYQAWSIRADGGDRRPLTPSTVRVFDSIWMPDGKGLAVLTADGPATVDLSKPLEQRLPERLPNAVQGDQAFVPTSMSADRKWIIGEVQANTGGHGIARYSLERRQLERLFPSGTVPVWVHGGKIAYIDAGKVFLLDVETRKSRLVQAPPPNTNSVYKMVTVAPDARTLYVLRSSDEGDIKLLRMR
jgi:serine/threonine protein kinase/Tol biopolymer transport system component